MTSAGDPTCCDMIAALKKTPVPMIEPITNAVVLVSVNPRINWVWGWVIEVAGLGNAPKCSRNSGRTWRRRPAAGASLTVDLHYKDDNRRTAGEIDGNR